MQWNVFMNCKICKFQHQRVYHKDCRRFNVIISGCNMQFIQFLSIHLIHKFEQYFEICLMWWFKNYFLRKNSVLWMQPSNYKVKRTSYALKINTQNTHDNLCWKKINKWFKIDYGMQFEIVKRFRRRVTFFFRSIQSVRSFKITHARFFYFSHYSFQLTKNYANYHIYTLSLIHALYAVANNWKYCISKLYQLPCLHATCLITAILKKIVTKQTNYN